MANRATGILGGVANFQMIRDPRGTGQRERGVSAGVEIELGKVNGLVVLFTRTAMATGGTARGLPLERAGGIRRIRLRLKRRNEQRGAGENQCRLTGEPPKEPGASRHCPEFHTMKLPLLHLK